VYDIADRRIGQKLANGVITSLSYDDANRLNDVESRNSSTVLLSSFNYLLDPAGNRTTLTASGSDGILWSYDKTNQLLTERRTLLADTYAHTYTYDPRGNRLTLSDSTDTLTYTCDDANRLETVTDSSGTTTYAYDANGNQLTIEEPSGDITTNTWNGENRLVLVEHPDSTETAYRYNGDGLRVAEDHDGTVTLFLYDGNNRLQETDETGLVEAEFTYIPLPYAEVLSQHRDMESSFYLCDGIRNIRQLTDDTQAITDEYSFDAFGNLRSSTGSSANSQLYKGHLLSYRNDPHAGTDTETSTHFRNQSAQTGRFTSEDPAADDHNLYRLVGNNPVNGEDPSGLDEKEQLPRYNAEKRYGFTEDGRYLVTLAGQPMEPCIICHGRGAFGHYPGLTFTDSFVGGQWYRSGSNEHVIGNASSGFASGATLLVPRLLNGGSVAGKAIWQFVTDPDDRSTDWILDTPLPTDKWEDSIETWVYKDREKDSLITMSGRIGGETTATFGLTEGWSIGLSSVRTARLASAPVLSSQSAGLLAARLTPFGGSVIKIGSPVSTLGSSVVTTSTLGTSVSTGAEIMSGVSIVSFRSAGMLDDVGRASSNSEVAPKSLANIGELAAEHQATLKGVWRGEQPLTALPESVRQQLAGLYSRVASENPAGFAQAAFNEARAKFLLGQGPNPGPSVNEFARRMGIPVFKRN
jgi:RHS repeat-associated protein